ncbi:hypothetical protein BC939DRAFT_299299 [Gamsiella multidivaricata]|uniref:uncharacterized protein n=1 Tax=Gamsiella multidivaricata TaxID=101098 RepID=UPI0022205B53|nr:uncharacterized protein BC939DRAFT_299299 [Gamsiella multidivaricata]KAI7818129.1 hypothetical protein BC939DRAFT_299299 [Gamsiella multidivaricata]
MGSEMRNMRYWIFCLRVRAMMMAKIRKKFINLFKDKCVRGKAATALEGFLKTLLSRFCSSLKKLAFTVVTKLARDVYDMYIAKHAQAVRPDNWMATSNFLAPLAQEMAKDFTMLWESQNEQMIKQFKKRDGGDGRFFDERTLPKESLLVRFLHLRELVDVAKRPVAVPISPIRHGFITITEQELFYSIHDSFREDVLGALKMDSTKKYKLNELEATFKRIAPDEFLCNLICPSKSLNLNPKATCNQYTKRYVLTGTFQTDGFQLRLLACDTRVTKGYKPSNPVPGRVDPKVGTDRWLKEIRNEFSGSAKELQDTFGSDGRDVWIGGIDLGQVVTAAVSVLILDPPLADGTLPWPPTGKYCTLNIKQKALMQPQFKYRRAIEGRKTDVIHDAESSLLPRRGISDEDVRLFLNSMDKIRQVLNEHYNQSFRHHRDTWDLKKARDAEDRITIEAILKLVKEDNQEKAVPTNKVLWGVGLGKFGTSSGLTSLHGTFSAKLISALRTRSHAVVGINEYYASQKCPFNSPVGPSRKCDHGFVERVNMRSMYCLACQMPFHRDSMAAQNMVQAAHYRLFKGIRHAELQPLDSNGQPIWS